MKQFKIIAIVSADDTERRRMMQQMLVKLGLAITPGDAAKLIKPTPDDFDLSSAYYVAAGKYNLASSDLTTHQLYRLAHQGVAVVFRHIQIITKTHQGG